MSGDLLIRGGHVLTMDPAQGVLPRADVLVSDGRIAAVGGDQHAAPDARVIEAAGRVVMPGLVDTHRHVWLGGLFGSVSAVTLPAYGQRVNGELGGRFRADDIYVGVLWGALQALNAGVTTVADWAHNLLSTGHADANVRALRDSLVRSVFYYGGPGASPGEPEALWDEAQRLKAAVAGSERITLGLGLRGPAFSSPEETAADFAVARSLGLPVSVHVGMAGFPGNVVQLEKLGLLGPDVNHVHANELTDEEFDLIASSGGSVSMSPSVEMSMVLGAYPALGAVRSRNIAAGLAVDTVAAAGTDMFSEMRLALAAERSRANAAAVSRGELVPEVELDHHEVLRLATAGGAAALPLGSRTGSLTPGSAADVIIIDMRGPHLDGFDDPALALLLGAGAADVETVLVGGEIVKDGGVLVGPSIDQTRELLAASRAHLRSA
jgi:cytosine/adenosine deaminase-related metal-dependent hydrolase